MNAYTFEIFEKLWTVGHINSNPFDLENSKQILKNSLSLLDQC